MTKSSALPARAQNRVRRTALTVAAMAVSVALAVPAASAAPVAAAPVQAAPLAAAPVAAAPVAAASVLKKRAKKIKPKLSVKRSGTRQVKNETRVKLTIRAKHKGKAVAGKVEIRIDKKLVKTKKLKKGKATYTLSKKLSKGKKKIKVTYRPTAAASRAVGATASKPLSGTSRTVRVRVISKGAAVRAEALKQVGVRYRWGGTSPRTGFDCAGFVRYVYKKAGIANLSRTSSAQRYDGKVVSRKKARVGDLIWSPGHVAIYMGGNKQIDAPRPGKSIKVRKIWQSSPIFIRL